MLIIHAAQVLDIHGSDDGHQAMHKHFIIPELTAHGLEVGILGVFAVQH